MTLRARVVGLGQRLAGDDGVGLVVTEQVRASGCPGVSIMTVSDAAGLVAALDGADHVIVVDAVMSFGAKEPGRIHVAAPEDVGPGLLSAVSTHGLDVPSAIALARTVYPEAAPKVHLVGIEIERAERPNEVLSAEVAAAVPAAVAAVRALLREPTGGG